MQYQVKIVCIYKMSTRIVNDLFVHGYSVVGDEILLDID